MRCNMLIRLLTVISIVVLQGCSVDQVKKFAYNAGAAHECRRAYDNRVDQAQRDFECFQKSGINGMSYEEYLRVKDEIENDTTAK